MMYYTGYRSPKTWSNLGLVGKRLSFTTDEVVTKLGIGYIEHQSVECAMDTAVRFTLLNAGENGEITAKQMLNQHTRLAALFEAGIVADGWYEDAEGNKMRDWVYIKSLAQLHKNTIASNYYYKDTHFSAHILGEQVAVWRNYKGRLNMAVNSNPTAIYNEGEKGFVTYRFLDNIRELTNALDDKTVLGFINKSLNRMVKSGKAKQVTQGRGRTFRWNAWGWLETYRQKHLVTMAKQRKLGDVVNGWEFTKGQITNLYGVEICDHEWIPVEDLYTYGVTMHCPKWTSHSWESDTFTASMPHIFFTKEDAEEVADELNSNSYPRKGASIFVNGEAQYPHFSVKATKQVMRVKGSAMIEDYMPPLEMLKRMQLADKAMYNELAKLLIHSPSKIAGQKTVKE